MSSVPTPPPAATPPTLANAAESASAGAGRARAAAAGASQGGTVGDAGAMGLTAAPPVAKSTLLGGGQAQAGQ